MKTAVKHDEQYDEAISRAEADFRNSDRKEMVQKCPYLFSSNMADAYWITSFALYWTGRKPEALQKSRGNNWKVSFPWRGTVIAEVVRADQRDGVILKES